MFVRLLAVRPGVLPNSQCFAVCSRSRYRVFLSYPRQPDTWRWVVVSQLLSQLLACRL